MTGVKLPGWAVFFLPLRAAFCFPAIFPGLLLAHLLREKKQHLALDVGGDAAPALFVAAYRLERSPQQYGHFFLGLAQPLSDVLKVIVFHNLSLSVFASVNLFY